MLEVDVFDGQFIDITPHPRFLRIAGEIPFAPWQCIAELIDNAIDMFQRCQVSETVLPNKRIIVSWSSDQVPAADRQLEVYDTGPGMSLDAIQQSVRAGYTSNDPMNNLGLFGMGFNIATARLGERTLFLSATSDSKDWYGVSIDFSDLTTSGTFNAPVVRLPKTRPNEHGTRIVVSRLKPAIFGELRKSVSQVKKTLADIYAPILQSLDLELMVQSTRLTPRVHCTWDASRYVPTPGTKEPVPAVMPIDYDLGEALFDVARNRYLTPDEADDSYRVYNETGMLPSDVVRRQKRIHGWLGIQRYADPNDFGIDFLRNGRKILLRDKSLFSYNNPLTGTQELEYPTELGVTVGGRIVGEIHIDHVPPTYQKNDFDRADPAWYEVIEVLRGAGPILPSKRKALGFEGINGSPLGRLLRAYNVIDAGTRHLSAPNKLARDYAEKFRKGDPEFQSDERWWQAARDADRQKADKDPKKVQPSDPGQRSSDDVDAYRPSTATPAATPAAPSAFQTVVSGTEGTGQVTTTPVTRPPDPIEVLKSRSRQVITDSTDYGYPRCAMPLKVTVWEITNGKLGDSEEGEASLFIKSGKQCDFFYNPRHPFLRDYPTTYKELLFISLAEHFKIRDRLDDQDLAHLYAKLLSEHVPEQRIDQGRMQEAAQTFFSRLREQAPALLAVREQEVIDYVYESVGEVEEIVSALIYNTDLLNKFQSRSIGAINALAVAPARTLVRLVDKFPEEFFDQKFFRMPYITIALPDPNATDRLRTEAKERLLSFLKDALWIISEAQTMYSAPRQRKAELARCAHSLSFLNQEVEL